MSIIYRGSSINASYQVLVHLAMWFQRIRFLEIDQPETKFPVAIMLANRLRRNQHSL